jgi:hypothetical protein
MASLEDFVNGKFFVCLHFKLASFLQGLLLDERNLEDASRGDVMILAKRNVGKISTILFISLSTSSSFSGLDAIAEERQLSCGQRRGQDDRLSSGESRPGVQGNFLWKDLL